MGITDEGMHQGEECSVQRSTPPTWKRDTPSVQTRMCSTDRSRYQHVVLLNDQLV